MFEDDSVELLYCCHALEYFDRDQVNTVLKEWHRVLKPSGILRLAVPDFEAICNVYLKYKDLDHKGILGPLYGKWSQNDDVIYHRTVYDFTSLEQVLTSNGFNNIMKFDADLVFDADYDDCSKAYVPHLDKTGILISLNVEATK
jgi:predicted SAM-dependent methyltransferase